MKSRSPKESETVMTEIIFPNDTNPLGIVQGGRIVQLMDIACAICAQVHSGKIAVTASIDSVHFMHAAKLGDVLTINARITRVFTSSMEIYAEVTAKRIPEMKPVLINYAYFTFVALDDNMKPVPIPAVTPETSADKIKFRKALERKKRQSAEHVMSKT